MKRFLGALMALTFLLPAAKAFADSCTAPPTLTTPTVCHVPISGGTCSFGSSDGIVDFPDADAVTGKVTISGGKNVWIGGDIDSGGQRGGRITLPSSSGIGEALTFSNTLAGTKYFEGLYVDVNGNYDAFALRNHLEVDVNWQFVNNYTEGQTYDATHGDGIQFQPASSSNAYTGTLLVENFAVNLSSAGGQGLFIPVRDLGNFSGSLTNVYVRNAGTNPSFWFSSSAFGDPYWPLDLVNVYGNNLGTTNATANFEPNLSSEASYSGGVWTFSQSSNDTMIEDGSGGAGYITNGTVPGDIDLSYPSNLGLNYDRSFFCGSSSPPYTNNSIVNETNITATDIPPGTNDQPEFLFDGYLDDDPGHVAAIGASSFYVEFDLGEIYDMTNARIYGDTAPDWVTSSWTMEVKDNLGDAYTTVFSNQTANLDQWFDETISTSGRYVKITVNGGTGTQANELDITGTVGTPVVPDPPVAAFTYDCSNAPSCDFTDTSTEGDGTLTTWAWDFDNNGDTSSAEDPTYDFGAEGDYNVCLTVTDDTPLNDDFCATVSIDFNDDTAPTVTWSFGPFVTGEQTIAPTIADASPIYSMQLFVDGAEKCEDLVAPFSCTWTPPANDQRYSVVIRVTDEARNETTLFRNVWASATPVVNNDPSDTTRPDVAFVSAKKQTSIQDQFCMQITAFDANGLWKVLVSTSGKQIGAYTLTELADGVCFQPTKRRKYYIRAEAVDVAGNSRMVLHKVQAH